MRAPHSTTLWIPVAGGLWLLGACGDGGEATDGDAAIVIRADDAYVAPPDAGTAVGEDAALEVDLDAAEGEAGASDDGGVIESDGAAPGGDAATPAVVAMWVASYDAANRAACACEVSAGAYPTMADCLDANRFQNQACESEGVAATLAATTPRIECLVSALDDYTTCIGAASCSSMSALVACDGSYQRAIDACPAASEAYDTAVEACLDRGLGSGSCPEGAVSMGVGASVFSGTTVGAGNESDPMPTCWPEQTYPNDWGRGADRAFLWQPPSPGTYVIDTAGSSFDTVLYVRSACDAAADIACNDDVQAGVMRSSAVTLTSSSSTPAAVVIVVDGFTTDQQGSFVVNITRM